MFKNKVTKLKLIATQYPKNISFQFNLYSQTDVILNEIIIVPLVNYASPCNLRSLMARSTSARVSLHIVQ